MRTHLGNPASPAGASERRAQSQPVRKGDIRRVHALPGLEAPTRSALVVRTTASSHGHAEIMLTHDRVEMARSDDVVLHPDSDQFPNGIVVQTRLRGIVWHLQLSTLVTRLSSSHMADVARGASASDPSLSVEDSSTEPPEEWTAFRESELQALWALAGDCTDAMLDDDTPWRIDTDLLSADLLAGHGVPSVVLTEVMHILRTRRITATFDDLQALQDSGAFAASTWMRTGYGSDLASQIAIGMKLMIERALSGVPGDECDSNDVPPKFNLLPRVAEARELSMMAGTRLVTAPFLWTDGGHQLLQGARLEAEMESPDVEVMMVATPDHDTLEDEHRSHGV